MIKIVHTNIVTVYSSLGTKVLLLRMILWNLNISGLTNSYYKIKVPKVIHIRRTK